MSIKNDLARRTTAESARPRADVADQIRGLLESNRGELVKALPKAAGLTPERLTRIATTCLRNSPALQQCSVGSLMAALITCAQLGLDPMPAMGHAYLVPYKSDCQLVIGYRGIIALARRTGEVSSVEAHIVHANDHFEWEQGTETRIVHRPAPLGADPGAPVGVYAVARLSDGTVVHDVLRIEDIERARASSKARGGPWDDHWGEMARKTAVRRLGKYLPMTAELARAVEVDEGVVLDVGKVLDVREEKPRMVTLDPPDDDDPPPADDGFGDEDLPE